MKPEEREKRLVALMHLFGRGDLAKELPHYFKMCDGENFWEIIETEQKRRMET